MGFTSQQLWQCLVDHFNDNPRFAQEFNIHKAWEKTYYNLEWKGPDPKLVLSYRADEAIVRISIYNDNDEILASVKAVIDKIEADIGSKLAYRHKDGRTSEFNLDLNNVDDSSSQDNLISVVEWIIENSLKLKKSIQKHVHGIVEALYSIQEIISKLDKLEVTHHNIQSNMVQLGANGEEATTIHRPRDPRFIMYCTVSDFIKISSNEDYASDIVKLDANSMDKEAVEDRSAIILQNKPDSIVCISDGNKVYNSPPAYQPHMIYAFSNNALDNILKILYGSTIGILVNDSVWVAAALMAYEVLLASNNATKADMYFRQADIRKRAASLTDNEVRNARTSQKCNADAANHSYNYLRGDNTENSMLRRLTVPSEFDEKSFPTQISPNYIFKLTDGTDITFARLLHFAQTVYSEIINQAAEGNKLIEKNKKAGYFERMTTMHKTEFDHNLILYGPPGTGKTYSTAIYAVAICDGEDPEELEKDYDAVMERYEKLKKDHRIEFTTFHQSYGYEEFIEGIKPALDDTGKDIGYTIADGIFKRFCEEADMPEGIEIDYNASLWFVRLETDKAKQNKDQCYRDNEIKFNWPEEGYEDFKEWFINKMNIGDYIVSYSQKSVSIDAVGIIEGEVVIDDSVDAYKYRRKVKWLFTGSEYDVKAINSGKYLPNFELSQMKHMKIADLLDLVKNEIMLNPSTEKKPYVFVIDEINRGNISKIFGELITLIETTKRKGMIECVPATLPYSGEIFSVPQNVYILGTMNTADRSIALMDTALRRRFSFVEMMPKSEVLDQIGAGVITYKGTSLNVSKMLDVINKRIEYLFDREHTIGHAFFTGLKDDPSIDKLALIFKKNVIPLLQEYFYEDYSKIQLVLGDNAKPDDAYKFILNRDIDIQNVFNGTPDLDLSENQTYSIQESAFYKIESYKTMGKNL